MIYQKVIPDFNYPIEKLVLTKKDNRISFNIIKKIIIYFLKLKVKFLLLIYHIY